MEETITKPATPPAGMLAGAKSGSGTGRIKFLVGGGLILLAIIWLIWSNTTNNAQYFMTVRELKEKGSSVMGRELRVSGAVLGKSIQYDPATLTLKFTVAHIPGDNKEIDAQGGLANVLHQASIDPSLPRLDIIYHGVQPDLLRDEAQAIVTGKMGEDGVFQASELLLKCPTKYEEAVPQQSGN
ncbi:MAG TPA: cytochrome c maturation protein CcmE [Anaerolineaceae bacterium]